MPAFDASMSGGHGNPFFDLMEMSSVLSSTAIGDPLIDSTGTNGGGGAALSNLNHHHSGIFQSGTINPKGATFMQQPPSYGMPNVPSPPMNKDFGYLIT